MRAGKTTSVNGGGLGANLPRGLTYKGLGGALPVLAGAIGVCDFLKADHDGLAGLDSADRAAGALLLLWRGVDT